MNPETAETALVRAEAAQQVPAPAVARPWPGLSWFARLRADGERMQAVRDTWFALWSSRLLVWAVGMGAVLLLGNSVIHNAFDPPGLVSGFGPLGNLLAAPAARWDGAWYLWIAHYGYEPAMGAATAQRAAFFPLYPLVLRGVSELGIPAILAGVLVSVAALGLALYGIHRLATLELRGPGVARTAVLVIAFAPMAFFFSAVYSESLYLALSVGVFWAARHGRWWLVGALGALAGATRSAGIVLLVPALILYLYGPREDRAPDFLRRPWGWAGAGLSGIAARGRGLLELSKPRYRVRFSLAWLALMPLGLLAYMAYMGLEGQGLLAPFRAQEFWDRQFAGPFLGVWQGLVSAVDGARQLLSGSSHHIYFPLIAGNPMIAAGHDLLLFAFLIVTVPMVVGVIRRLPAAYGLYVLAALSLPLSYPVIPEPLMSLPRFLVVLFPLGLWLGAYLAERPRLRMPTLALSGILMIFFTGQFATWHWVA
jgi:hypothetical protein